jgi:hypothetical protein
MSFQDSVTGTLRKTSSSRAYKYAAAVPTTRIPRTSKSFRTPPLKIVAKAELCFRPILRLLKS